MLDLYEFQKADVEKSLQQIAVLNGSDMGVGKTIVAIETMKQWREDVFRETGMWLPILIVTPQNTFESWANKLDMQVPQWTYHVLNRTTQGREDFITKIAILKYDIYICNYESMRVMQPKFDKEGFIFSIVCADEVHAISNRKAKQTLALKSIRTHRKLAMSGTASGTKPWNLWSVLNWLWPKYYTSYWTFIRKYCITDLKDRDFRRLETGEKSSGYVKIYDIKDEDLLHYEIYPFYIRHNKKTPCCPEHPHGVMDYLPDKNYEKLYVDLTHTQRKIYDEMMSQMVAWVGEQEETPFIASIALTKMMRLMQTTLATPEVRWEIDENGNRVQVVDLIDPSPKIDLVEQIILENEDENYIVYTQSKKAANLCGNRLREAGVAVRVLSGDTPKNERASFVSDFQSRKIRVIVAIIRASEGFDGLQDVCSTIIFLNRDLSAFKNQQAEDRLHRQGQKNPVTVIDIIARDTLDEERLDLDAANWQMILKMLDVKRSAA